MPTSRRHEFDNSYSMGSFHNATAFSNAVIGDSYDLQAQSRGRDHRLLSQMNNVLHTDSPPTSHLLSSRSSKPRNISQLQPKTRRSTRLETTGTEPFKTSRATDSFKTSKTAAPLKTPRPHVSQKLSRLSDALNATKLTFKHPMPSDSLNLPKPRDALQLSKSSESSKRAKPSESLQLMKVPEFVKIPKHPESLQLTTKIPHSLEVSKFAGIDRMSPVVEHARSLLKQQRTFGTDSKLDNIAASAVTLPRDLKTDFFTASPLTNYVKNRWPEKELADLPVPISIEEKPRKKKVYKNPYLDSDDEEYELSVVQGPKKGRKTGDVLKALRNKRSSQRKTEAASSDMEDEDEPRGAYAIKSYEDDEDEVETVKGKYSRKYEVDDDSSNEVALSHLVSAAALRARAVLENLTGLLGKGGLVKVEGDIKPYGGELTTFRLHSPFHFQGPVMVGEKPVMSVGDDSFERYICRLQEKRKDERIQVERDTRQMSKLNRTLTIEPPKRYSLRPIGYISDPNYESFTKSLVPFKTGFDKTVINPSSKTVHFDAADAPRKLTLSRELGPFVPQGPEDEEMAVVPRKKRYPIYEYVEDIPVKMAIEFPRMDDDDDRERLSVLEKIRIKALLVGDDKLDEPGRPRPRKPRTRYYAEKLNKLDDKEQLSSFMATPPPMSSLKASKPPNYRIESRLEPDDLIHKPSGYGRMRDQVRGVQDKLDRHRQLLDRYREPDSHAVFAESPFIHRKNADLGERINLHADRLKADPGFGDSYVGAGGAGLSAGRSTTEEGGTGIDGMGKVSPLRKKLRKVICKSRHNPSYYDE